MAITNRTETRNFTASSTLNDATIMYMNATYNAASKELSYNRSIRDTDLYKANKETVDAEYDTWCDEIYTSIFG